jgi:hypothetical protein
VKVLRAVTLVVSLTWLLFPTAYSVGQLPVPQSSIGNSSATQSEAKIRFSYENPQLQPAKYVITMMESGAGHYTSEPGSAPQSEQEGPPVRGLDREIYISKASREAIFAAARQSKFFAMECDGGGGSRVAFQGTKTLEYSGPEGRGSCTYNWTKNKQIQLVTDECEGIAFTLEEGARLQTEYDHSRLSLDPELEQLDEMAREGRALELQNIAPILKQLAEDDAVLKRVQRKAAGLLDMAKP